MDTDLRFPPAQIPFNPFSTPITSTAAATTIMQPPFTTRQGPELRPRQLQQQSLQSPTEARDRSYFPDTTSSNQAKDADDGMPAASDFVRKLVRMLEDPTFNSIVCWGPQGDSFIVKDMTEFTKVILPRLFKHSNFASFVRQLNKYDFHKVKNADDTAYGEHCWTFRHPKFRIDDLEGLESIKRKSAPTRKPSTRSSAPQATSSHHHRDDSPSPPLQDSPISTHNQGPMQIQIDGLLRTQDEMRAHITSLETNYRNVLDEMVVFHRSMATQDALIQNLLQYFLNLEQSKAMESSFVGSGSSPSDSQFLPSDESKRIISGGVSADEVVRASLQQMSEMSKRANLAGMQFNNATTGSLNGVRSQFSPPTDASPFGIGNGISRQDALSTLAELQRFRNVPSRNQAQPNNQAQANTVASQAANATTPDWFNHPGLQVLTVGHLMPRDQNSSPPTTQTADDLEVEEQVMPSRPFDGPTPQPQNRLRVRRKTFVPGWAVPPRVLLVEDDAVSRKLSSKFLQVLGVTTDFAIDGDDAVKQMSLEQYDLVLMDIVMPRLDGVSATSLIRRFDHKTPIISMTSNSCPQDILNYYNNGMNDILPKPFTRDGLLEILEKHLNHLKNISQLSRPTMPRTLSLPSNGDDNSIGSSSLKVEDTLNGILPSNDFGFDTNAFSQVGMPSGLTPPPGMQINSIAGLGLGDNEYANILASMTGDLFATPTRANNKRPAEDDVDDVIDHPTKRGRFEVVE